MEMNESVKNLKCLCLEKIVDYYKIDIEFSTLHYLNNVINIFQKVNYFPSVQQFYEGFKTKDSDFERFLCFFCYYVWNPGVRNSLMTNANETVLASWLEKNSEFLSEISFIGCKYKKGNLCFGLVNIQGYNVFKQCKVNRKIIKFESNQPKETYDSCHKLLKLTVLHKDYIKGLSRWSIHGNKGCNFVFFDIERGTLFHFSKLLKYCGYPAFICKAKTYKCFKMQLFKKVTNHCKFYKHEETSSCTGKHFVKFLSKNNNYKCRKSFKRLTEVLARHTNLEEVELNLIEISDKQKLEIIHSLNNNLKHFKVLFCQPFNFIVYIGKRFKNLQTLDVAYLCKDPTISKDSKYFDKLNRSNVVVFSELKCLKLHFTWRFDRKGFFDKAPSIPLRLNTIFTILKGCQKSLTCFELHSYYYNDVKRIIDAIFSQNVVLERITFDFVYQLGDEDILNIVKFENCDNLKIKLVNCWKVTEEGISAALAYIELKNSNKTIECINEPY